MTEPIVATCVECGQSFTYQLRGKPQVTCSSECREQRRRKLTSTRVVRWATRHAAEYA